MSGDEGKLITEVVECRRVGHVLQCLAFLEMSCLLDEHLNHAKNNILSSIEPINNIFGKVQPRRTGIVLKM